MDYIKQTQIGLKLNAQQNVQLTSDELLLLSDDERTTLRNSVADYLKAIDNVKSEDI